MPRSLARILKRCAERFTKIFKKKRTALLDTNILFSKVCFNGRVGVRLFEVLKRDKFKIVLTPNVLEEVRRVVKAKFPIKQFILEKFLDELPYTLIDAPKDYANIPQMRDEKDRPILAAAIHNEVDFLITGDKDFLVLKEIVSKPKILTMAEFLELYGQ